MPVSGFAGRVHRDAAVEHIDGLFAAIEIGERDREPLDDIARSPAKLMLCAEKPLVVEFLAKHEAVEEIIAVERHAAFEIGDIFAPSEAVEIPGVDRAQVQVQRQGVARRGDQRATRTPNLG